MNKTENATVNALVNAQEIDDFIKVASQLAALFIRRKAIARNELPGLMEEIYAILVQAPSQETNAEQLHPAVPIERSVMPDYIVCLEDGKKLKMLKRHLKTYYGLTPAEYKRRWGLPPDYPIVAPNYAKHRSEIAKSMGLGSRNAGNTPEASYWKGLQVFDHDERKAFGA
ncbi:MAG: MucR family transcriptional regulator [Rhodospirillales bacterium]|nr:MucR family transcriptional regulator [Rhodospirillales bacterium]